MRTRFAKNVIAASLMVGLGVVSTGAAAAYNDFVFDPLGSIAAFTADKIVGGYSETITINPNGTFDVSILWDADSFYYPEGSLQVKNTGIGSWDMYALFTGTGTVAPNGSGFKFTLNSGGSFGLYYDPSADTSFTLPSDGSIAYGVVDTAADDILLGTGGALIGVGSLTCTVGNNCGSFGQETSLYLTTAGKSIFTSPVPFYNISLESGQFNGFDASQTGTTVLNGSLDVTFKVPEPASLYVFNADNAHHQALCQPYWSVGCKGEKPWKS